ncbi:MAG: SIS domain-containing protein [Spirochaetes bacterium]|nr:SIS domain-containing protein [Spirochaetota bacterium]
MNLKEEKYSKFSIVQEMLETSAVLKKIDLNQFTNLSTKINSDKIFLTGEGSSRIFPAKNLIYHALKNNYQEYFVTECSSQAMEYDLSHYNIFISSNSGKTKEAVRLLRKVKQQGHQPVFGVTAHANSNISSEADFAYDLVCGSEQAVAATKSVMEQALFYDLVFRKRNQLTLPDLEELGNLISSVLTQPIPQDIIHSITNAETIYFCGRNNGVAEELTLKTNEITRKKSDFLEGTYAVHGIEEVMTKKDVIVIINPFAEEEEKFREVLAKGVGLNINAISSRKTSFPTFQIPDFGDFTTYLELAAGWSLLIEAGIKLGINLDKPERARKIGNELEE